MSTGTAAGTAAVNYRAQVEALRAIVFNPELVVNQRGWREAYKDVVLSADNAITQHGWTRSPTHMMDEEGAVDFNGAFAIAIGIPLEPGRNEPVYDVLEEWFQLNPEFKLALVSAEEQKWPGSIRTVGWLSNRGANFETAHDAQDFLGWVLDVLEVRGL